MDGQVFILKTHISHHELNGYVKWALLMLRWQP